MHQSMKLKNVGSIPTRPTEADVKLLKLEIDGDWVHIEYVVNGEVYAASFTEIVHGIMQTTLRDILDNTQELERMRNTLCN